MKVHPERFVARFCTAEIIEKNINNVCEIAPLCVVVAKQCPLAVVVERWDCA